MPRLEGKTAVVTGATAGIGLAIARRLAVEGAHVFLTGRGKPQLDQAVESIGAHATGVQADSADPEDLDRLYAQIASDGRRLDILVANAGDDRAARLNEITAEHLDQLIDLNVKGTLYTVQKALPLLNDGASVILIGSVAADGGAEGYSVYAATKAAVRSFARTWANELKGQQIRVNTLSPGPVNTPGNAKIAPIPVEEIRDRMAAHIPLGRIADPDEIANVALFLAGTDSSFLTGTNICVDGGLRQI